jgi:hypothetical protein
MQHIIRFNGHISRDGQANGLPEIIYAFLLFDGDDTEEMNKLIESQSVAFVRSQAMIVQRNQGKVIDLRQTPQDRMLVPMHWIVNVSVDINPIIGELSYADSEGIERFKDGSEPVKQ